MTVVDRVAPVVTMLFVLGSASRAQDSTRSLARCDSIVAAARVDAVDVGLFTSIVRIDGGAIDVRDAQQIAATLGSAFVPPRPFRLNVFSGPVRTRILRPRASDSVPELQSPTVTGVYRLSVAKRGVRGMQVVRASLMVGFDSAAMQAIEATAAVRSLVPPAGEDSMRVEVRFSTDSTEGAKRITSASFPRMPVVNAIPHRDNPHPAFPDEEKGDSTLTGEVVLRFVVDRDGKPVVETVELVRGTALTFVRAALAVLPRQVFSPATIRGCPISQRVEFPFTFAAPAPERKEARMRH